MRPLNNLLRRLRALPFAASQAGAVAMEFALSLPILVLLLLGGTDTAFMMIVTQRVDRVAYSVTDIVSQSEMVTNTDINNILLAASQLMQPFTFGSDDIVIFVLHLQTAGSNDAHKLATLRRGHHWPAPARSGSKAQRP